MWKCPWPNPATIRREFARNEESHDKLSAYRTAVYIVGTERSVQDRTDAKQAAYNKGHADVLIRYSKQASINDDRNIKRVTKKVENNCVVSQYTCSPGGLEHVLRKSVTRYLPEQQTAGGSVPMCGLCSVVQQQQPATAQLVMWLHSRKSLFGTHVSTE